MLKQFKTQSAKGVLSILTGGVISKAIWAIFGLVLSKYYGAENFGIYNVFLSYLGILSIIATLRLEHILVVTGSPKRVFNFYFFLLKMTVLSSLFILLITVLLDLFLSGKGDGLSPIIWLLIGIGSLLSSYVLIQNALFTRFKFFNAISVGLIINTAVAIVFQILFYFIFPHEIGFYGLIVGYVLGITASIIYYLKITKTKSLKYDLSDVKRLLNTNKDILKYAFPSESINTLANNLFIILAAIYFDKIEVGVFALALKILGTPMVLLFNAFSKVYFQKAAQMFRAEKGKLLNLTLKVSFYSSALNLAFLIGINTIGIYLLKFYFTPDEWPDLQLYMLSISFWILARSIVSPITQIAIVINRNQFSLWMNIGLLLSNVIGIYAGMQSQEFITAILAFSISAGVIYLIFYLVVLIFLKRLRVN